MLKYGSEKASKTDREYVLHAIGVKINISLAGQSRVQKASKTRGNDRPRQGEENMSGS